MMEQKDHYQPLLPNHKGQIELKEYTNIKKSKQNQKVHGQQHLQSGDLLKSFVYAGFDGINSTLILLLSGYYSGMAAQHLFYTIIALAISGASGMGMVDYFSQKASIEYVGNEYQRQQFQVENCLQQQKKEIIKIYQQKGYTSEESSRVAQLISTNKTAFVNIMMLEELSLVVSKENISVKRGLVTFVSFTIYGLLTAFPYIITVGIFKSDIHPWKSVILNSGFLLVSIGYGKASLLGLQKMKAIKEVLLVGVVISIIAITIGMIFEA